MQRHAVYTGGKGDGGGILHTVSAAGEPVRAGAGLVPPPRAVREESAEFLTKRPLKGKLLFIVEAPTEKRLAAMKIKIDAYREESEMDFLSLAKKRYSARSYLNRPVEPEKLQKVLEAGRAAPTACNKQPQRILVVRSPEGLRKIGKCCRAYNAPVVLIVCADRRQAWVRPYDGKMSADIDASIVTDHMMLCAADCGLDSVWVCAFNPEAVRDEFGVPEHLEPINLLFLGYADGKPASPDRHEKLRLPLGDTVSYEQF